MFGVNLWGSIADARAVTDAGGAEADEGAGAAGRS
jgi:hypothetical protein